MRFCELWLKLPTTSRIESRSPMRFSEFWAWQIWRVIDEPRVANRKEPVVLYDPPTFTRESAHRKYQGAGPCDIPQPELKIPTAQAPVRGFSACRANDFSGTSSI